MFIELLSPAICAACNMLGGIGVGYAYHDVGVSVAWVDRHTLAGKPDEDMLMGTVSYQALHVGRLSVGPYVGRTFAPDGKGPKPITAVGLQISWGFK
jgi:hypothetical protein